MTKDQAVRIIEKDTQYFIQCFIPKDGELKLTQVYGPLSALDAERIKSMNSCKLRRFKKSQFIKEIKRKACIDCGIFKNEMTFDHIKGTKKFDIATGPSKTWTQLCNEISKCEIVCRTCHNVREYFRGVIPRLVSVGDLAELLFR